MSHPEHLPIYKLCYQLLALSSQAYKQMPRDFKPTLGRQIMADCAQMAVLVSRANACTQAARAAHITQLLELLSATQMLLRLCHDLRMLSHGIWAQAIQIMDGIGKQAGGWRKHASAMQGNTSRAPAAAA